MARCPFATWTPISGSSGPYVGGPFRIVHHTSEGSSASGAMAAYRAARADPHFTVDRTTVFQHVDTDEGAWALRNGSGGVHTNRLSAIQIELVGFAGRGKSKATLVNVARLCRWIEAMHGVPRTWPAGPPRPPSASGGDPGGHNRSVETWTSSGGHYGHSQIPGNSHWDPAYLRMEVDFLMNARFDAAGALSNAADPLVRPFMTSAIGPAMAEMPVEVIEDHFDVGEAPE
jgi:N-acetylmuramoyl-L-alanine amidase-like protein